MSTSAPDRISTKSPLALAWALTLTLCVSTAVPGWAQDPSPPAEAPAPASAAGRVEAPPSERDLPVEGDLPVEVDLAAEITSRFEVLPTRSGLLLRPRAAGADFQTLEVSGGEVAVDGQVVGSEELASRLGAAAQAVQALADLPPDEARALVGLRPPARRGPDRGLGADESSSPAALGELPEPPELPELPEPPEPPRSPRYDVGERVSFASSVTVDEGEIAEVAVAIGGNVRVDGVVEQDAVAVGGNVEIDGLVEGNAVAVGGSVHLGPEAVVEGDVSSVGGKVIREEGSRVSGNVSEVSMGPGAVFSPGFWRSDRDRRQSVWERQFHGRLAALGEVVGAVVGLILLALLVWLVTVMARAPVERVSAKIEHDALRCLIAGFLLLLLFVPVLVTVGVVLLISVIGIPLLVLVPFVLLLLAVGLLLGYAGVARWAGHWLERRLGWKLEGTFLLVLVGVTAIQIWTVFAQGLDAIGGPMHLFAAILWTFGVVVKFLAWTIGLGAVILTRFGAGPRPIAAAVSSLPPGPIPAAAAMPVDPPPPHPAPPPAPSDASSPFWEEEETGEPEPTDDPPEDDPPEDDPPDDETEGR